MQTISKEKKYVVINIGSSYITGMLAIKHSGGHVQPLAMSRQASRDNIKRGYIHNIDGTAQSIGLIIDELSSHLKENEKISGVYVGLECVSMRSRIYRSQLVLSGDGEIILHDHIQTLRDQVQDANYGTDTVVRVMHPRYYVDGKQEIKPQGVRCRRIDAIFQVITVRQNILDNLYTTFRQKLDLDIYDILITPIAEATVLLSSQEAVLGCAYINIGGGTTSVSIYKDRLLAGLYVLPMGGRDVTRDIESLALIDSYAEQIKLSRASMDLDVSRKEVINIEGTQPISLLEVNRTVAARMVEIMSNVVNITNEAATTSTIGDLKNIFSWVFAGGGTNLNGFMESIGSYMEQSIRVAYVRPEFVSGAVSEKERHDYASELALINLATKDCVELIYQGLETLGVDEPEVEPEGDTTVSTQEEVLIGSDADDNGMPLITAYEEDENKEANIVNPPKGGKKPKILGRIRQGISRLVDKINAVPEED